MCDVYIEKFISLLQFKRLQEYKNYKLHAPVARLLIIPYVNIPVLSLLYNFLANRRMRSVRRKTNTFSSISVPRKYKMYLFKVHRKIVNWYTRIRCCCFCYYYKYRHAPITGKLPPRFALLVITSTSFIVIPDTVVINIESKLVTLEDITVRNFRTAEQD